MSADPELVRGVFELSKVTSMAASTIGNRGLDQAAATLAAAVLAKSLTPVDAALAVSTFNDIRKRIEPPRR